MRLSRDRLSRDLVLADLLLEEAEGILAKADSCLVPIGHPVPLELSPVSYETLSRLKCEAAMAIAAALAKTAEARHLVFAIYPYPTENDVNGARAEKQSLRAQGVLK